MKKLLTLAACSGMMLMCGMANAQSFTGVFSTDYPTESATLSDLETTVGTHTTNIAANKNSITALDGRVTTNEGHIADNKANIATNTTNIAANTTNIATNTANIATNATNIADNKANIATNAANIATNQSNITTLQGQMGSADFSTGKGAGVKLASNVTDAILEIDKDFHRTADGKIHIGRNSFVLDDTNGDVSFYDSTGAEKAVNFTKTPTVNGVDVATVNETNRLNTRVDNLKDETRTGMASVAALTALQPLGMEAGRLQFQLGTGFYKGEAAMAAGANFYATENIAFNAGVAADTSFDNNVVKAGVSFGFLKPKKQYALNANHVTINAAKHTAVQAKEGEVYITPAQLKALLDRIEALEKQVAQKK